MRQAELDGLEARYRRAATANAVNPTKVTFISDEAPGAVRISAAATSQTANPMSKAPRRDHIQLRTNRALSYCFLSPLSRAERAALKVE
jgi:hypothetical protein